MKTTIEILQEIKREKQKQLLEISGREGALMADIKYLDDAINCVKDGRIEYVSGKRESILR